MEFAGQEISRIAKIRARLRRALDRLGELPLIPYTLVTAIASFLLRIPLIVAITVLIAYLGAPLEVEGNPDISLIYPLVIGPIVETFMSQWLPIKLVSKLTRKTWVQIAVSTVLFSVLHAFPVLSWGDSIVSIFAAAIPGLALAYTFILWQPRGRYKGFLATTLTHSWANAIVTVLSLLM